MVGMTKTWWGELQFTVSRVEKIFWSSVQPFNVCFISCFIVGNTFHLQIWINCLHNIHMLQESGLAKKIGYFCSSKPLQIFTSVLASEFLHLFSGGALLLLYFVYCLIQRRQQTSHSCSSMAHLSDNIFLAIGHHCHHPHWKYSHTNSLVIHGWTVPHEPQPKREGPTCLELVIFILMKNVITQCIMCNIY